MVDHSVTHNSKGQVICTCGWKPGRNAKKKAVAVEKHIANCRAKALRRLCPKVKYGSKKEAERVLLAAKIKRELRRNPRRQERRAYLHDLCGSWHLTSYEGAEQVSA